MCPARPILLACLCGALAFAAPAGSHRPRPLPEPERGRLALERFTFGPLPGQAAQVEAGGLDGWFEAQLHPETLDDSALERRLDAYPALRMTQAERLGRYPAPATLRRLANAGAPLPADPELRAILADQVEFYERGREGREKATAAGTNTPATPVLPMEQATAAMDPAEALAILALQPAAARYARLLTLSPPDLIALRKALRAGKGGEGRLTAGMTPLQAETVRALAGTNRMLVPEVEGARLLRDIYSSRQLQAVMTEFWLNHFNVFEHKSSEEPALLPAWEQTVRTHALGRFEDLLVATAQSPAMLLYLDQAESTGPGSQAAARGGKGKPAGLNENYARELMELHTLGADGGYTQADVTEVARVFTGWTVTPMNDGKAGQVPGTFHFVAARHEPGAKTVLGVTVPEGGEAEGLQVLHLLATRPATAHQLSLQLAQRFVADDPPPALVRRMEATYLRTGGDIGEVLRTLFHSPELWTSATAGAKLKTPLDFVLAAVRATGAEVVDPAPLQAALGRLGMPVYGCPTPNGYPVTAGAWLNAAALLARLNFALDLASDRLGGGVRVRLPEAGPTPEQTERTLEAALLPAPASEQTRRAALASVSGSGTVQPANFRPSPGLPATLAGLLLGSPEFQRR